jgi:hypothetical protein
MLAEAIITESEQPEKDFGALVRSRRKDGGLSVEPRGNVARAFPAEELADEIAY